MENSKLPNSKPEILVIGAGYLGSRIAEYFGARAALSSIDITNLEALKTEIDTQKPKIVINAAAKTQTNQIEKPENQDLAFRVNVQGPANLCFLAGELNFKLVHISSGMFFDGTNPDGSSHKEDDTPQPVSYYAWTKAWADALLQPYLEKYGILITRIHLPISAVPNPRNLLDKLRKFNQFLDAPTSATVVEDFLAALDFLLQKQASGVYHLTNAGQITFYEIAQMLQEAGLIEPDRELVKVSKEQFDQLVASNGGAYQSNPLLNIGKLTAAGFPMPELKESVRKSIEKYKSLMN